MLAGACSGFGYWGITYPLDVIKTRLQQDKTEVSQRQYKGWLDCARQMYQTDGFAGFWKGYVPCLIRALVVNSCIFLAVTSSKRALMSKVDSDASSAAKTS